MGKNHGSNRILEDTLQQEKDFPNRLLQNCELLLCFLCFPHSNRINYKAQFSLEILLPLKSKTLNTSNIG